MLYWPAPSRLNPSPAVTTIDVVAGTLEPGDEAIAELILVEQHQPGFAAIADATPSAAIASGARAQAGA